jgi:hypothetical protein
MNLPSIKGPARPRQPPNPTKTYLLQALNGQDVVTFWRPSAIDRLRSPVLLFDAVGLALFAVAGAQKALAFGPRSWRRSSACLKPTPPPDPSGRHQNSAVARRHRTVLAYWKFESISLHRILAPNVALFHRRHRAHTRLTSRTRPPRYDGSQFCSGCNGTEISLASVRALTRMTPEPAELAA